MSSTTQRPDRSILVGGQRESSTSYLLDGVELRNPRVGDTSINPSLDLIQEFKGLSLLPNSDPLRLL